MRSYSDQEGSKVPSAFFQEMQSMYEQCMYLINVESEKDPESEPYRSKYAAQEILVKMKSKLEHIIDSLAIEDVKYHLIKVMLGVVCHFMGTVCVDTEEFSLGEEHLTKCVECMFEETVTPEDIQTRINALNQLGILWSRRGDWVRAREVLERAEQAYKEFTEQGVEPMTLNALFQTEVAKETLGSLDTCHTLTLYYLAQVLNHVGDSGRAAKYCHRTLCRQSVTSDLDRVTWALDAATLSQYFIENGDFKTARHHLSAASAMLDRCREEMDQTPGEGEEWEARRERFSHRSADVGRCWAKYGLLLLKASQARLMAHASEEEEQGTENSRQDNQDGCVSDLRIPSLDVSKYESQVATEYSLVFEDARKVFLNARDWMNSAQEYYTLEDHATDNVHITQDMAELYKALAFFEEDSHRCCVMHKRRAEMLEGAAAALNPQYYLQLCRSLWFEAGLAWNDVVYNKIDQLENRHTPQAIRKVNLMIERSIGHFNSFLDSFCDARTKEMPEKVNDEYARLVILAYFYLASLHHRKIVPDKKSRLENYELSLKYHKLMLQYSDAHPETKENLGAELSVCRELATLLPKQLESLRVEIQRSAE